MRVVTGALKLGMAFAVLGLASLALSAAASWLSSDREAEPAPGGGRVRLEAIRATDAEPPLLQPLIASGRLPAAAERLGSQPLVISGPDGLGSYGGTWFRASDSIQQALFDLSFRLAGATLVRWSVDGTRVTPGLAVSWSHSDDYRRWEFTLRPGVRWSDGHPVTTRDVEYMYTREIVPQYTHAPAGYFFRGKLATLEVIDEFRFALSFTDPNPLVLERLASDFEGVLQPAHYLGRYHPDLGEPSFLERERAQRGLASLRLLYTHIRKLDNPAHPRLWPWILLEPPRQSPVKAVRNPYFWCADVAGRQLPYFDQVIIDVRAPRMIPIAAGNGQLTFQEQFLQARDWSYLHSMELKGACRVFQRSTPSGSRWALYPNLNRRVDPDDPSSSWKAKFLGDRRFRQAVSLAIDRLELIAVDNLGIGEPAQISPPPGSPYFDAELRAAFTVHDPPAANRLLDQIGLTSRDAEGFRTFPDGSKMTWLVDWIELGGTPPLLLAKQMEAVGLRFVMRQRSTAIFPFERGAGRQDFIGSDSYPDIDPAVFPVAYLPIHPNCYFAAGYGLWFATGGLWNNAGRAGGIEPPVGSPVRDALELYDRLTVAPSASERSELFSRIARIAREEVWTISVLPKPPALLAASPHLRNVPEVAMEGFWQGSPSNAGSHAFFLVDARTDTTLMEWYTRVWGSGIGSDETEARDDEGSVPFGKIGAVGFLALLAWMARRSRFVAKRLAAVALALAVVSVAVFAIVQWPPGSFVDSKRQQLEASGLSFAPAEIAALEEQFFLKDPAWKRYLRWSGLYWFSSFREEDRGLLQGELGRSMETGRPIADMLGERLVVTSILAFAALAFTWAVALPLGIATAARAGSWLDRTVAFLGLFAISMPGFLLALGLLFLAHRVFGIFSFGLFSPEYAARPGFSWGKFLDLIANLWIPLVVLGLSGAAGMIRLLRVNVLEELRRPYVLAARARGVRPSRLLLKYPTRMALNPFASGVGAIFPYMVSGEVIVATLLGLPTVGPVLLAALLSQDLYLAASTIMILTVLAMLGTLVSDLLLVWLDPRIRL